LTRTFRAPRTFDPSYSLLGRAFRRWTGDRLRGEALFLLTLTGGALGLLMVHYLGWALLQTLTAATPAGEWQLYFWAGQVASVLLLVGVGGIGFQPEVRVAVDAETARLHLRQGRRERQVPLTTVDAVQKIGTRRFHMHERRYAVTDVFASTPGDAVLRLDTSHGPIVIGLPSDDDLEALHDALMTADRETPVAVPSS